MPKNSLDAADPMELCGVGLSEGSVREALEALIDEYVRLGYREAQLRRLFADLFYRMPYAIVREVGDAEVARVIRETLARWKVSGQECEG